VDENALAAKVRAQAVTSGQLTTEVEHGGTVCNSYGYKADTEVALAISDGRMTVVFMSRVSANKATKCGGANACIPGSGFVWHGGRLNEGYVTASWSVIRLAFEEAFTQLELLAACADA
jgi:hypothetical protein